MKDEKGYSILYEQIRALTEGEITPMHMPGHKRILRPVPGFPYELDLTETEGADDLHHPGGILQEAMDRTASLWGSEHSFYLVNGSTCGILAGIRALAPYGSTVIAARNCHRSVFHAIELGNYRVRWLLPGKDRQFGICGSIAPEEVERALEDAGGPAAAVIVTSPTYEGVVSDIKGIAKICHRRGVPLFVDEAHGAHLGLFAEGRFPVGALKGGADVVVQSAHKTLPSLTQTALLHVRGAYADPDEVRRQLAVFETSSPSYPLMISLDSCTGILREKGAGLFAAWGAAIDAFEVKVRCLSCLRILGRGRDGLAEHPCIYEYDRSKILINTGGTGKTGAWLARILRERYGIETEMCLGRNVLAMTGCGDAADPSRLERLGEALSEIDREAAGETAEEITAEEFSAEEISEEKICEEEPEWGEPVFTIAESIRLPVELLAARDAAGRISAEYVYCYPPGVPAVAPGERITKKMLRRLESAERGGSVIRHSFSTVPRKYPCLKER